MTELITEARNATLDDMVQILREQHARKIDLVLPGGKLKFDDAQLRLSDVSPIMEEDGVTDPNGLYLPTPIFDEKLADYLKIPTAYVRRMRSERPDLYDANANGWLQGRKGLLSAEGRARLVQEKLGANEADPSDWKRTPIAADDRKFLIRLFRGDNAEGGVARTILSNRYKVLENLDGLLALLGGIKDAGIDPEGLRIDRCDLTERRMYVKVTAPEIQANASEMLKGYRNPFAQGMERVGPMTRGRDIDEWRRIAAREGMAYGEEEGGEPIVFAGFVFSNSEVGGGKWSVTPAIEVQICKNGLVLTEEAFGRVHLGAAMDEGVIDWSDDVQEQNLRLVKMQTAEVVQKFLTPEYVQVKVDELTERAGVKLSKPADEIKAITKKLAFSEDDTAGILEHFMLGGQITAGGLMQAITSYSQTVEDADSAHDMEAKAVRAMEMAAVR